ncbi:hypothetical protein Tco_1546513 [Tanacetum coccineum]
MWNNVANIPSFVPKAASVPAGSRNSPTSVPADSRNRPTSVPAGRPFNAGWKNHVARPITRPTSHYFQHFSRPGYYNQMYMDEGRWGTAENPHKNRDLRILDSGCSRSMAGNKEKLDDFVKIVGGMLGINLEGALANLGSFICLTEGRSVPIGAEVILKNLNFKPHKLMFLPQGSLEKYGSKNRVLAGFGIGGKAGERVYTSWVVTERESLKLTDVSSTNELRWFAIHHRIARLPKTGWYSLAISWNEKWLSKEGIGSCPRFDADFLVAASKFYEGCFWESFSGRVKVPAGRYVVPTGKDNVIVSAGRTKVIPAGSTILVLVVLCLLRVDKPKNVNEALTDESWIVAMQEEIELNHSNDVREFIPQPRIDNP